MDWSQWLILATGPAAIGLSQIERTKRWACIVGLCGQAGWFAATWKAQQWGMFLASFVYAGMWCIGLWRHWLSPIWSDISALDSISTHTAGPSGGPVLPRKKGTKPKLVGGKDLGLAKGVPPER